MESTLHTAEKSFLKRLSPFQLFKFGIFSILTVNLFVYLKEDVTAYLYLDPNASIGSAMEAFAVTIDYVAWMVLIVLFEFETSALAKGKMTAFRKYTLGALTAVCYVVLVYAAYGYAIALYEFYQYTPLETATACDLVDEKYGYMSAQARPVELTADNCAEFNGQPIYKSPADRLIASDVNLVANQKLGWVDVANATAWLIVVLIFQIEIMLQQSDRLTKLLLTTCTTIKITMYLILAGNAIYWTIYSAFIDSWDAWLWLLAFVLIDLNLLGWDDSHTAHSAAVPATAD